MTRPATGGWRATTIRIGTTAPDNQTDTAAGGWRRADYQVMVRGADRLRSRRRAVAGQRRRDHEQRLPAQAVVTGNSVQTLETRVRDVAGNASAWRSETIRIDKVPPVNTTTEPTGPVQHYT